MVLFFLRHAEAERDAETDFARKLTSKGVDQAEKAGKFLLRLGIVPDVILTSPLVRARQTAKIVADRLGDMEAKEVPWLAAGMAPETYLREIQEYSKNESVMVVGHEPDFSETIAYLLGLPDPDALKIRKTTLTAVQIGQINPGKGQLQFLVPARLM